MDIRDKAERVWERIIELSETEKDYWLVRFLFLRVLGFTYFFAFLSLVFQLRPLLGSDGLTPVKQYLPEISGGIVSYLEAFWNLPTLFWFNSSDQFMMLLAVLGLLISFLILIGYANVPMVLYNWLVYLSFVNAGQVWYGYGWETQLIETGFLAIFMVPLFDPRPFNKKVPPPVQIIWLLRWLALRVFLGAGLIKLKGSSCWDTLTCLDRYFETQPIPNPVSPWMHRLPSFIHKIGVLMTHIVQLIVPFGILGKLSSDESDTRLANYSGLMMLLFQFVLIFTGNLAFLNWVTIAAVLSYFDDQFLSRFLPEILVEKAEKARDNKMEISDLRKAIYWIVVLFVTVMSIPVMINLVSGTQAMNASFNQFNVVNTYGAFGSVRPYRTELVMEGTTSSNLENPEWKEYDFRFKPDQENDTLPLVAPYQPRIAWQMWFASMSEPQREPWLLHFSWKLLENDPEALKLVGKNPFKEDPPEYIRIKRYRYEYTEEGEKGNWERSRGELWMPAVSRESPQFRNFIERRWS